MARERIRDIWVRCPFSFCRVLILHFPTQAEGCVKIDNMQDILANRRDLIRFLKGLLTPSLNG